MSIEVDPSSFRDPSGFVFREDGRLFRRVNPSYMTHFERFESSGLYDALVERGFLIPHRRVPAESRTPRPQPSGDGVCLEPALVSFISYPYEWCFSQMKDAALLTLAIQKASLERGMVLKDASAYNVQFKDGRPVFIDTLSFETWTAGEPWIAYRQFCEHFLAPLALMSWRDPRLSSLTREFIDGIPLDLCASLLPLRSLLNYHSLLHLRVHSKMQRKCRRTDAPRPVAAMSRFKLLALADDLECFVKSLRLRKKDTTWGNYHAESVSYSSQGFADKRRVVLEWLSRMTPGMLWDVGANDGEFSRMASQVGFDVIAFDMDPVAVERNYLKCRGDGEKKVLPLLMDFANPTPGIGWMSRERRSLFERGTANAALALALVHHLRVTCQIPLTAMASFFSRICRELIIEFIPKDDPQARRLLANRRDVFDDYAAGNFEREFGRHFTIRERVAIKDSRRMLYLMGKD